MTSPCPSDVDGRAGQPERGQQDEPARNMPAWLIGGEGQQPLDVPLPEAEQRADHRGEQAEGQEHGATIAVPVAERRAEHRPVDPGDAVQPELDHDPENSTHTGVGATACASASQKWNGTIAPLIEQAGEDEHERHHDQAVGRPVPGEVPGRSGPCSARPVRP